jgi:hypothetical protein
MRKAMMTVLLTAAFLTISPSSAMADWDKMLGRAGSAVERVVRQANDDESIPAENTNSFGAGAKDVRPIEVGSGVLTQINLSSPTNGSDTASAPTFTWTPDGGVDNRFAVDLHIPGVVPLWTSPIVSEANWAMPQSIWDFVAVDTKIYWRARGADLADPPINIITSDEVWSFNKIEQIGWTKTFGGADSDWARSVQQTNDGGYIVAGVTDSYGAGGTDAWLIKADADGIKEWDQTFGGTGWDRANSVQQTSDGGYIVAGFTYSYGAGGRDAWLIKTDSLGNKQWDKTFGGIGWDDASSVQQTTDGGYIVAGETGSYGAGSGDVLLIKTDPAGNMQWYKTLGGSDYDAGRCVQQTGDGGYIIVGNTLSFGAGSTDVWLIKTDANGVKEWDETFGGSSTEHGKSVQQTADGGYIIGAYSEASDILGDAWLIKTDANGNKEWDETFGGPGYDADEFLDARQTTDGGYIIAAETSSYGAGSCDAWLIKTDGFGIQTWEKTFGGPDCDYAYSVQQTNDGGYILVGGTASYGAGSHDVWLIKTDENGNAPLPEGEVAP